MQDAIHQTQACRNQTYAIKIPVTDSFPFLNDLSRSFIVPVFLY